MNSKSEWPEKNIITDEKPDYISLLLLAIYLAIVVGAYFCINH